jgi:uncharacterized protein (DUF302 family)
MLQVRSPHRVEDTKLSLRRAVERRGAGVQVLNPADVFPRTSSRLHPDLTIFLIVHHQVYHELLAADVRLVASLPWRIAVWKDGDGAILASESPREWRRLTDRPGLAPLLESVEASLLELMQEAALSPVATHHEPAKAAPEVARKSTEEQVNMRGAVPQRIDRRGSKVEDLAGTGKHDAPGG